MSPLLVSLLLLGSTWAVENVQIQVGDGSSIPRGTVVVRAWLEVNPAELKAKAIALPSIDQTPFDVNTNLIVEFYR